MDDSVRKTLRRACAHFNTGIRKPFVVDGRMFTLDIQKDRESDAGCLTTGRSDGGLHCKRLKAMTPEILYEAIMLVLVDEVHAL